MYGSIKAQHQQAITESEGLELHLPQVSQVTGRRTVELTSNACDHPRRAAALNGQNTKFYQAARGGLKSGLITHWAGQLDHHSGLICAAGDLYVLDETARAIGRIAQAQA